MKTQTQLRF